MVFSSFALLELWLAGLSTNAYDVLGNMYAFGAATAYMLVFVSLLVLRFTDPWTPRPFKIPLNIRLQGKDGEVRYLPIVGMIGFIGISSIFVMVVLTHSIGRIAGPAWIIMGLVIYVLYRRRNKLPIGKSIKRDWEEEQLYVYEDAGEHELATELRENLTRKHRLYGEPDKRSRLPTGTRVVDVPLEADQKHKGEDKMSKQLGRSSMRERYQLLVSLLIIPLGTIIIVRAMMLGTHAWTLLVLGLAFVGLGIVRLRTYAQTRGFRLVEESERYHANKRCTSPCSQSYANESHWGPDCSCVHRLYHGCHGLDAAPTEGDRKYTHDSSSSALGE